MKLLQGIMLLTSLLCFNLNSNGQWNTNTSLNLQISGLSVGDMQSVSTNDGKLWVAFYHENAGSYDMRAQLFDVNGNKLLGADGILVSNKPTGTATFVFNVCTDLNNNLIIGCQDERTGSLQAVLYKINQSGTHVWNSNGVILGSGMVPYPATLTNGETVVVWNEETSATLKLQKITNAGAVAWSNPISILVGSSTTTRGQIVANLNSKFTVVYQKNAGGIATNLYAQHFDNSGTASYAPLQICNQTTAPYRYYSIAAEGDTTYFGYYSSTGNRFNSFLQRINPNGTIPWGMNGSAFNTSTSASDAYQMTTNIALTPNSPYVWSVSTFSNTNQSAYGVYLQKFKKSNGARQFTDQGKTIYPISTQYNTQAGNLQLHNDTPMVMTYDKDYKIYVTKLDASGNFVWSYSKTEISSTTVSLGGAKGRFDFWHVGNNKFAGIWTENRGAAELGYIQGISKGGLFGFDITTQGSVPATITTGNGTLQLQATVLPSYANQNANWSIIPITGDASISPTGLVTAIADGTVWAKGIAVQDETMVDSLLITISGQIPVLADVVTLPANNIAWYQSTLNGSVNANFYSSTVSFEWGLTNTYGNVLNASPSLVTGGTAVSVLAELTGLAHSTTYHYRCKAINQAGTAYGQDLTFTTDCFLSGAIGSITGPTELCSSTNGIVYEIPTFAGATGYVWSVPAGVSIVAGNNTNSITVDYSPTAQSGNISVYATNGACYSSTSEPLLVNVSYPPSSPGNIIGVAVVCDGDQGINYSVNPVFGAASYTWTVPSGSTIVSGASSNNISVNFNPGSTSGNITCYATNDCGTGALSIPLFVNVEPVPGTPAAIDGPDQLCTGNDEITYSVPPVPNAYGYAWSLPPSTTIISGSNTNQITVKYPVATIGLISVIGTNGNCNGPSSPFKGIYVYPIPVPPVVTTNYDTLISSSDDGNQWYFQGNIIPGATQKKHLAEQIGYYTVIVTLNNCSSAVSNSVFMSPVSIGETETNRIIDLYPNPNKGNFTVVFSSTLSKNATIKFYTQTGALITTYDYEAINAKNEVNISLGNYTPGVYWMVVESNNHRYTQRVVIE